jgi:osmotically-inducible protein OsmY
MNDQERQRIAARIRDDVLYEFAWDVRLQGSTIDVTVENGSVVLSGIAPTYGMRLAALRAVARARADIGVINNIRVIAAD